MLQEYQQLIQQAILDSQSFVRATFTGSRQGASIPWTKVVLRPVLAKKQKHIQFAYFDDKKCITKNYSNDLETEHLKELIEMPFKNIYVATTHGDIQVNVSKKGRPIIHRLKASSPIDASDISHNRQKESLLPSGKPDAYLQAIGFMTRDGDIRSDKQRKFRQINEFLKLLQHTGELDKFNKSILQVVDFGCGNAYLTFAVYHYLNDVLQIPTQMVGIDVRGELLENHSQIVKSLGWEHLEFQKTTIAEYVPATPPDITLSLHACDTATDEALAQGIRSRSKLIISVPCCHHNLQKQFSKISSPEPFRPVQRHGILGERMGDVLTDAFRALILRIAGYHTDVIEFISAEHTAKNVMIRAVYSDLPPSPHLINEYVMMKDYWKVVPYLESLLGDVLTDKLTHKM